MGRDALGEGGGLGSFRGAEGYPNPSNRLIDSSYFFSPTGRPIMTGGSRLSDRLPEM